MSLPTTLTGITIIGSTLHWDIYPQLNIVKIPLKKLFSLVLTIQTNTSANNGLILKEETELKNEIKGGLLKLWIKKAYPLFWISF